MMGNEDEGAINVLETGAVVCQGADTRIARQGPGVVLIRISHPGDLGLPAQFGQPGKVEGSDPSAAY